MGRLVAFDQQTASTLVARTRTAAQLGHGSPLKAALSTDTATLLMPSAHPDQMLVVSIRRPSRPASAIKAVSQDAPLPQKSIAPVISNKPVDDMEPVSYEATGFLGLRDAPVYASDLEEEARQAKKKWWQKLLE